MAAATAFVTVVPAPTATLTADPAVITAGQPATLTIASTNAQSAVINPGNHNVFRNASGVGSVTVSPTATTEYTLTVTDANGFSVQATATVTVTPAPTATLSADPTAIARGQSTTLEWTSSNGVTVEIVPDLGIGALGASGSVSVSPATSTIYTLTVTDANDAQVTASAAVTVATMTDWVVETVAGDGTGGYSGDGAAVAAQLNRPHGLALDAAGNLYIADRVNHRIRKVAAGGVITTVAGSGTLGFSGDGGAATAARLTVPEGVAVDAAGNLYIADAGNHRIRKVDTGGVITTVAGSGTLGYGGDGGAATAAQLNWPRGVAVDAAGNVYIADVANHRIRKIDTEGAISTVAGAGTRGAGGDGGLATAAQLGFPNGVALDAAGNLYIADTNNHRIRKVDAVTGVIATVAGDGTAGYGGDGGLATAAQLRDPWDVALDAAGNL